MKNLLVVSCVCDDRFAPISMYLMKNHIGDVVEGAAKYASGIDADIMYLLPEGEKIEGFDGDVRFTSKTSPTLNNPYSVVQVLTGNLPRPMIQDDYVAVYEDKTVFVITPQAAYEIKNGQSERFVVVNTDDDTQIKKVAAGSLASDIVDTTDAKAVLLGGLKGSFVTGEEAAKAKIDGSEEFDSITVFGKNDCMVDVCAKLMNMAYESSCGKCVLCREGTSQFRQIVTEMTTGKSKAGDLDLIREVSEIISVGAYCPFGQNMTRPLTSAIALFPGEFEDHIKRKTCKCGKCYKAQELYYIDPDECIGCGECIDACPEEAIEGKDGYIHMIDQDLCEHCGKCVAACDEGCIKTAAKLPRLPKKRTKVGKW